MTQPSDPTELSRLAAQMRAGLMAFVAWLVGVTGGERGLARALRIDVRAWLREETQALKALATARAYQLMLEARTAMAHADDPNPQPRARAAPKARCAPPPGFRMVRASGSARRRLTRRLVRPSGSLKARAKALLEALGDLDALAMIVFQRVVRGAHGSGLVLAAPVTDRAVARAPVPPTPKDSS